jgi:hypothetical protein
MATQIITECSIKNTNSEVLEKLKEVMVDVDKKHSFRNVDLEGGSFTIDSWRDDPLPFLEDLTNTLGEIKKDVYIYGFFADEYYDSIGAFLYGLNYDDVEFYDEIDSGRMQEDENYREEIFLSLWNLNEKMEKFYINELKDINDGNI